MTLTAAPLGPGRPLSPGRPRGPCAGEREERNQFAIMTETGFVHLLLFSHVVLVTCSVTHHRSRSAVLSGSSSLTLKRRKGTVSFWQVCVLMWCIQHRQQDISIDSEGKRWLDTQIKVLPLTRQLQSLPLHHQDQDNPVTNGQLVISSCSHCPRQNSSWDNLVIS